MSEQFIFDESYWAERVRQPDWYMELIPYIQKSKEVLGGRTEKWLQLSKSIRYFLEQALLKNQVALGDNGPNFDEERQPIDTVVIHHTSAMSGYRLSYMNAVHLLELYGGYFYNPSDRSDEYLKGAPLWSGHFKGGKQVFYGYHWLMRMDGSFERLVEDNQIGWQAGNWEINKRSVGICLDNDYEKKDPADDILEKLAKHIKKYHPSVNKDKVIGHCEAREGTICPGTNFLKIWKPKLAGYL